MALQDSTREGSRDLGLLLLRLAPSVHMVALHGWGKLSTFAEKMETFLDPLGVGSRVSLALTVFGEVVCPALVALGALTRLAAVPAFITMAVAAFVVHAGDPWGKRELALLYAACFLGVVLVGAGRLSVDELWRRRRGKGGPRPARS